MQTAADAAGSHKVGARESFEQESAAKLQSFYRINHNALKRIRKLSEWFIKHKSFQAANMRRLLGELVAKSRPDRVSQTPISLDKPKG